MNPKTALPIIVVLFVLFFGQRFVQTIPPGHVGVAALFGQVKENVYTEGMQFPVNPFYNWVLFDTRQKTHKEAAQVPTRDQLQTRVDVSVQYHIIGAMAPRILQETGGFEQVIMVHLIPTLRSKIREEGSRISNAEDFFEEETRSNLETGLLSALRETLAPKGIEVQEVLIRDINLPKVLSDAIEKKKEREQEVERQKAELERFRTEQMEKVVQAEAQRRAAEETALQVKILADAKAYEIRALNKAIASNPAYIQLQALEALTQMSKDPAAKIYMLNGDATQPLPLLNIGK